MVVGHNTITCLLSCVALKAARNATSVLPKPTSPQTRRSMILWLSISFSQPRSPSSGLLSLQTGTSLQIPAARQYLLHRHNHPVPVSPHTASPDPLQSLLPHRAPLSWSGSIPASPTCSVSVSWHRHLHISGSDPAALRDIKISALCIRNLHIILRNLVYDDLLDPLIDPDTMILMDT